MDLAGAGGGGGGGGAADVLDAVVVAAVDLGGRLGTGAGVGVGAHVHVLLLRPDRVDGVGVARVLGLHRTAGEGRDLLHASDSDLQD